MYDTKEYNYFSVNWINFICESEIAHDRNSLSVHVNYISLIPTYIFHLAVCCCLKKANLHINLT